MESRRNGCPAGIFKVEITRAGDLRSTALICGKGPRNEAELPKIKRHCGILAYDQNAEHQSESRAAASTLTP